jgi:hypothetical protein
LAIELVLTLRLVFRLALRQAEAFSRSVLRLLGLALPVPDHTTLSRRGRAFARRQPRVLASADPMHLVLDSTGLQLFGQGEWDAEKHGRARRQWRKLHLAVDAGTGEIAAHVLTDGHADDAAQLPGLLGQVEGVIVSVTADGAYDGEPTYAAAAARQRHPPPDVVVPPRASAVPSSDGSNGASQSLRDRHIQLMAERGRMGWQEATGDGRRNQAETAMARYRHLIGPKLRGRSLPGATGRGRHRRLGAEQDDPNCKAHLRPRRLISDKAGPFSISPIPVGVDGPAASRAKVWLSSSEPEGPSA